jgi:nucleolin
METKDKKSETLHEEAPEEQKKDLKRVAPPSDDQPAKKKKTHESDSSSDSAEKSKPKPRKGSSDSEEDEKKPAEDKVELYVSNVPYTADEASIDDFFSKYGKVVNVKLLKDKMGRSKGIAFVKFETSVLATKALGANETELDGRKIRVNFAGEKPAGGDRRDDPRESRDSRDSRDSREPRESRGKGDNQLTVFVGNISFSSTKQSLEDIFRECGKIKDVRIPVRDDGKPRGFAHIEFEEQSAVDKALKMNGTELDGRNLKVDVAGNNKPSGFSRGSSRGGRGGFRGYDRGGRGSFHGSRGGSSFHGHRNYDD